MSKLLIYSHVVWGYVAMGKVKWCRTAAAMTLIPLLTGSATSAHAYSLEEFKQCLVEAKNNLERSRCYWKRERSRAASK